MSQADGKRSLRIAIHEQYALPMLDKADAKIAACGGLSDATFLIDNGYCFAVFHD
jgi:hypothetical protein